MLPKNIEILIRDSENGQMYNASGAFSKATITQARKGEPSTLRASFHNKNKIYIPKGSEVMVHINGNSFFKGFFFEDAINEWNDSELVIYDQLRYLMNIKTSCNVPFTATEILYTLAKEYELKVGPCEDTGYKIGPGYNYHDGESLYDIITHAIHHTLINTGMLYNIRDDYGYLRIQSPASMVAKNPLASGQNVFNFRYNGSIGGKTYNSVKLYWSNEGGQETLKEHKQVEEYVKKWGVLQYYAEVDGTAAASSDAGIKNMADNILAAYCREIKSIHLSAVGDESCVAGSMVFVDLGKINGKDDILGYQLVDNITHKFENNQYTMELDILDINTMKR